MNPEISRRTFLQASVVGGSALVLGFRLAGAAGRSTVVASMDAEASGAAFAPNAYLRIDGDGIVTVTVHRSEMGQRVDTSLPMILADELEADWASVRVEHAPPDPIYGDQYTGGSVSVSSSYWTLRMAGAAARTMLVGAAAATWGVGAEECRAENGAVVHDPTGSRLPYANLVEAASQLPVPPSPSLKEATDLRIIGTRRGDVNAPAYVTGQARYASDLSLPGMLVATVARPPTINGAVSDFDPEPALAIDGVRHVVKVSSGVAVVADTTWAATLGRAALDVTWDEGDTNGLDSDAIRDDATSRLAVTPTTEAVEAVYEIPFLAHVSMEPMTCVADVRADSCVVWAPTQDRQAARRAAAGATGLEEDAVTVHVPLMGGAFGRRLKVDYVWEAAEISQAVGAPVKVFWTREDDIRHDFFHPYNLSHVSAPLEGFERPTVRREPGHGPQTGDWRSVRNFDEGLANGCFIDELAAARGQDVLDVYRTLYSEPILPVVELAAAKSGWGTALPDGWGRGIAAHTTFGATPAAIVIEASVLDGRLKVRRAVCAVDCGIVIDPSGVEAQIEGGIVFALSAALHQEITLSGGRIDQSSLLDYPVLRMDEMPVIEVHMVPSDRDPSGVGEMGVPPTAPALLNAVYAATGRRIRHLPIRAEDLA